MSHVTAVNIHLEVAHAQFGVEVKSGRTTLWKSIPKVALVVASAVIRVDENAAAGSTKANCMIFTEAFGRLVRFNTSLPSGTRRRGSADGQKDCQVNNVITWRCIIVVNAKPKLLIIYLIFYGWPLICRILYITLRMQNTQYSSFLKKCAHNTICEFHEQTHVLVRDRVVGLETATLLNCAPRESQTDWWFIDCITLSARSTRELSESAHKYG